MLLHRAYVSFTLYGAAKAAVIYLAKGFSSDLLGRKIRANVITPVQLIHPHLLPEVYNYLFAPEATDRCDLWLLVFQTAITGHPLLQNEI
jgi:NAD(P)-dependent dehydrogenase (short-subunit alcohol dehydrogenase family)